MKEIEKQFINSYYDNYSIFVDILFVEVGSRFICDFEENEIKSSFNVFFEEVPVSASITAILNYLSKSESNAYLKPLGSDIATNILKSLFKNKFKNISSDANLKVIDNLISHISTIPDTIGIYIDNFFQKETFIPFIINTLLLKTSIFNITSNETLNENNKKLWGGVITRFIRRGYNGILVKALYNVSVKENEIKSSMKVLYECLNEDFEREKLISEFMILYQRENVILEEIHDIMETMLIEDGLIILQNILFNRMLHVKSIDWILGILSRDKSNFTLSFFH